MKTRIKPQRNAGSGLLLFIVVTFALFIAGVSVYHLVKWAKKVSNGETIKRPGFTNDEEVVIPPGNPANITGVQFINPKIWFAPDPGTNIMTIPAMAPSQPTVTCVIKMLLAGKDVTLSIGQCAGAPSQVTYRELGVPVDEWGMPEDLTYQSGTIPTGEFQCWELLRSTNGIDWEPIVTERLYQQLPGSYQDQHDCPIMFYRARRVQ